MNIAARNTQNLADQPHILVVDDDLRILQLVTRFLEDQDFVVMTAENAAQAREMLDRFVFDALVVDVMMPGESGLEFTASISDRGVPVILLTALGEVDDRIAGFEVGADDYLPKPFEPRELVMRLHAILKRTSKPQNSARPFMIGRWRFDPEIEVIQDDKAAETVKLTSVEANLIRALAAHSGEPVSREELARICGIDAGERTIDVQVTRLRRKIEEDTKMPRYLQTIRGKGYLLRIEEL